MSLEVIDDVSTAIEPSNPAPATEPTTTPAVEPSLGGDPAVTAPVTTPVMPVAPVAPAYQPNFKYSVKGQEKEINEMFRSLIKDADTEKQVKELFERADGLDVVKQDRTALKAEYEGFKEQIKPYLGEYHKFTQLRDGGNLGAAFQVAGISDEQIFQYALQKLQMDQNPQMAQLYKNHNEVALRSLEDQGRLQHLEMERQQLATQQFNFNLDQSISAHKDVVQSIEGKWGKPGSFREEVVAYGLSQYHMGRNVSEADAVQAVLSKYKPFLEPQSPVAPVINLAPHVPPSTIPNAGSANISPVSVKPKSVDDLRKLRDEAV